MNINYTGAVPAGTKIADIEAGQEFLFETARNEDNNGLCTRVKDTKAGKARFVNLETGKLLTASDGDVGRVVEADVSVIY